MKTAIAILATAFAATAFAAEPAKTEVKPAVVTAPAPAVKKDEKAPVKSTVVKDEKAAAPATAASTAKPASK